MAGQVLYLDASAVVKLAVREAETPALHRAVRSWPIRVSSIVSSVEVSRAARRSGKRRVVERAGDVLRGVELLALDDEVARLAATVQPAELRSVDAVHVATALVLGSSMGAFACYDRRLRAAAEAAGLAVLTPV
jgi:uncharacterized protein